MKNNQLIFKVVNIYGMVVTAFIVLIFVPKIVSHISSFSGLFSPITHWYDNPTAFVYSYILGYIFTWKKPLTGAMIILIACAIFVSVNPGNMNFLKVFIFPVSLVGVLNIIRWMRIKEEKQSEG